MRIDLSNKYVAFMVKNADLSNGCSIIRTILWRIIVALVLGTIGVLGICVLGFVLAGTVLYLFSPWFGKLDPMLSLSWLGPSWWAEFLRLGAVVGIVTAILAALVSAIAATAIWGPKLFGRGVGAVANTRPMEKFGEAIVLSFDAAMAFGHKFCPTIKFKVNGPEILQAIANNPSGYMVLTKYGNWYKITKCSPSKTNAMDTRLDLVSPISEYDEYYIKWVADRERWDDDGISITTVEEYEICREWQLAEDDVSDAEWLERRAAIDARDLDEGY